GWQHARRCAGTYHVGVVPDRAGDNARPIHTLQPDACTARRATGSPPRGAGRDRVDAWHPPLGGRAGRFTLVSRTASEGRRVVVLPDPHRDPSTFRSVVEQEIQTTHSIAAGKANLVGGNDFSGDQAGAFLDRGGAVYNS